ncbi:MAG: alkyl hydroperoxide reductase [Cycloclasticus sp. symbiont of Poecilosclerida sp. M]|nr:MAG: alkyl hydroperoxide reductase [Cycloclasticus sp. symbiont of Poecilosclerida sp. M]
MALMRTPICEFDLPAPDFNLLGVDDKHYARDECVDENGLLVMFICNHCPYVKSIQQRLVEDMAVLQESGIGVVAIMSNDPNDYPADSFENMQLIAKEKNYNFPYLIDTTQQVAKDYDAICTPDFFGYNNQMELQYRGRLDETGMEKNAGDVKRDLVEAMLEVAKTGKGPVEQIPSMGCSIKWDS